MSPAAELASLTALDRSLLYVFVAGPGQGEGLAVALPGGGWLLVDGCTAGPDGRSLPLHEIITRYRKHESDPVVAMVLTHPHDDHASGFAALVDEHAPEVIALAGTGASEPELSKLIQPLLRAAATTADRVRTGAVVAAFRAIDRWREDHPGKLLSMSDEVCLPVGSSPVKIVCRAPDKVGLGAFLGHPNVAERIRREANQISIVLELEYGKGRVVLTGDLPRYVRNKNNTKTSVSTGWDSVMPRNPQLGTHAMLKIPHHGSADATHPALMPKGTGEDRAWCVTPYNSSRLPRVANLEALPALLEAQPSVLLTGVPTSKVLQASEPYPGIVVLSQLASRVHLQPTGQPFLDAAGVEVTPGDAAEPLDPIWCMAVDADGRVAGRWRGRSALEIVADRTE